MYTKIAVANAFKNRLPAGSLFSVMSNWVCGAGVGALLYAGGGVITLCSGMRGVVMVVGLLSGEPGWESVTIIRQCGRRYVYKLGGLGGGFSGRVG